MKKLFIVFLICCMEIYAYGLYLFDFFDNLLDEADFIFIGQVLDGKIIENAPTEYTLKIIEQLKGYNENEIIVSQGYYGLKIGYKYLFLLKHSENNIFVDFFEGVNKFEIMYIKYGNELNYCIRIPLDIIGMNESLIGELYNPRDNLWNDHLYRIDEIIEYIRNRYK